MNARSIYRKLRKNNMVSISLPWRQPPSLPPKPEPPLLPEGGDWVENLYTEGWRFSKFSESTQTWRWEVLAWGFDAPPSGPRENPEEGPEGSPNIWGDWRKGESPSEDLLPEVWEGCPERDLLLAEILQKAGTRKRAEDQILEKIPSLHIPSIKESRVWGQNSLTSFLTLNYCYAPTSREELRALASFIKKLKHGKVMLFQPSNKAPLSVRFSKT